MIINWEFIEAKAQMKYGSESTIELLAEEAGFSKQQYYKARRADSMSLKSLIKVARALDIEVSELFNNSKSHAQEKAAPYHAKNRQYDGQILEEVNLKMSLIERKIDKLIASHKGNQNQ